MQVTLEVSPNIAKRLKKLPQQEIDAVLHQLLKQGESTSSKSTKKANHRKSSSAVERILSRVPEKGNIDLTSAIREERASREARI